MIYSRENHERSLTVQEMYKTLRNGLKLKIIAGRVGLKKEITHPIIQKPGLRLTGVSDLQPNRVQVFLIPILPPCFLSRKIVLANIHKVES